MFFQFNWCCNKKSEIGLSKGVLRRELGPQKEPKRDQDLEDKSAPKRESVFRARGTSRGERDFEVNDTFKEEIRTSKVRVSRGGNQDLEG